ncbi:MAG: hypothetical protein LW863_09185 [Flammeovirgaceae bacterium]|nr:hypothetical protein [Flammeovirgaceae bacterium]
MSAYTISGGNDVTAIKRFRLFFAPLAREPSLVDSMTDVYSGKIPDIDDLFLDGATRTQVRSNAVDILLCKIITHVTDVATETTDTSRIAKIVAKWGLQFRYTDSILQRIGDSEDLGEAMELHCDEGRGKDFLIFMNLRHFHVRHGVEISFLNFDDFDIQPFDTTTIAGAIPTSLNTPALAVSMATGAFFNPKSLPADPQSRYETYVTGTEYVRKQALGPFQHVFTDTSGKRIVNNVGYYNDIHDKNTFILRDGRRFVALFKIDSKSLHSVCPRLTSLEPYAKRKWYDTLCKHAYQYGVYVHPWVLFRKDHGGQSGFVCSDSPHGDLPKRLEAYIQTCSLELSRLLNSKDIIPKEISLDDLLHTFFGRGHDFLRAFIAVDHPVFLERPHLLVKDFPTQKHGDSLMTFWNIFDDHLKLRAFIKNEKISMDDPSIQDVFIDNCIDGQFFAQEARKERNIKSLSHKFKGDALLTTLIGYTGLADYHPTKAPAVIPFAYHTRFQKRRTGIDLPHRGQTSDKNLNSLVTAAEKEIASYAHTVYTNDPPPALTTEKDVAEESPSMTDILSLDSLPLDSAQIDLDSYVRYFATINQVASNPRLATASPCIICGDTHTFENRPTLNNHDYLRNHFIKFSTFLRRDLADRKIKTGTIPPLLTPERLKSLKTPPLTTPAPEARDFQKGHG